MEYVLRFLIGGSIVSLFAVSETCCDQKVLPGYWEPLPPSRL